MSKVFIQWECFAIIELATLKHVTYTKTRKHVITKQYNNVYYKKFLGIKRFILINQLIQY